MKFRMLWIALGTLFVSTSAAKADWTPFGSLGDPWIKSTIQNTNQCRFRIVASVNEWYNYRFVKEVALNVEAFGNDRTQSTPVSQQFSAPLYIGDLTQLYPLKVFGADADFNRFYDTATNQANDIRSMEVRLGLGQGDRLGVYLNLTGYLQGLSG